MKLEYIQFAQQACEHTYKVCPLGSANRPNGESIELATAALVSAKSNFNAQISQILANEAETEQIKHFKIICLLARIAKEARAGNCQELAAVAFLFLLEKRISPLELVNISSHTFIIIGRDPATRIDDPDRWNEEAIICDPWNHNVTATQGDFFVHGLKSQMVYPPSTLKALLGIEYNKIQIGFSLKDYSTSTHLLNTSNLSH